MMLNLVDGGDGNAALSEPHGVAVRMPVFDYWQSYPVVDSCTLFTFSSSKLSSVLSTFVSWTIGEVISYFHRFLAAGALASADADVAQLETSSRCWQGRRQALQFPGFTFQVVGKVATENGAAGAGVFSCLSNIFRINVTKDWQEPNYVQKLPVLTLGVLDISP